MQSIEFVNHASIIISNGKKSILTDPWYEGDVFNKGWKLLHELSEGEIIKEKNGLGHKIYQNFIH